MIVDLGIILLLVFVGAVVLAAALLSVPSIRRRVGQDQEERAPRRPDPIEGGVSGADNAEPATRVVPRPRTRRKTDGGSGR